MFQYQAQKTTAGRQSSASTGVQDSSAPSGRTKGTAGMRRWSDLSANEGGRRGASRGSAVATSANVPSSTKYVDSTRFTISLGRNLKARKREKRMRDPMRGNFMASCLIYVIYI